MVGDGTHVLVTGGAGFIGSHVVDLLLERPDTRVTVLDKLTYAGTRVNLQVHEPDPRFRFVQGDVTDPGAVAGPVVEADRVIHAAAETHVDRSIEGPAPFVRTNVLGTQMVLEACREAGRPLLLVSTDEVYGTGTEGSAFSEADPLLPRSPYAASKAGAELLARSYVVTYGTAVTTVRGTNAFGPRQHPEKAVPTFILSALDGRPIPVYGEGVQRREWLYVRDFARAIVTVLEAGRAGEVYNIGGGSELSNRELAERICARAGVSPELIGSVPDRPGHDFRYGLRWDRLAELGWVPATPFEDGLALTLAWYRDHRDWVDLALGRTGG